MRFHLNGKTYSRICWLLDPGHGKNTKGKRSPVWDDGTQLLEYAFNREIVRRLEAKSSKSLLLTNERSHVEIINLVTEENDIRLSERAARANQYMADFPDTLFIFVSIHGDAFTSETAHGTTIFTSPGFTPADIVAEHFNKGMQASIVTRRRLDKRSARPAKVVVRKPELEDTVTPKRQLMKPHTWFFRGNKEAKFTVLMKTLMPALLLETGFYTNYMECKYMMSDKGQRQITQTIFDAMLKVQSELIKK